MTAGNTQSQVGKSSVLGVFVALLFAVSFHAEAQEAPKIPLIGILSPYSASDSAAWYQAFRQGLASLDGLREKPSALNTDIRMVETISSQRLQPSWCVSR